MLRRLLAECTCCTQHVWSQGTVLLLTLLLLPPLLQVSSYSMALAMESEVVGGPTAQGQPVFEWTEQWDDFAHRGMPKR
jgi:hypothetical protein